MNIAVIQSLEQEILNSMKSCDIQKLDELLHEDLLFNIPNGQTISKSIDLDTYRSGNMQIEELNLSDQKISLIENNAIVTATLKMKGNYFDHSLDGKYRLMRVWQLSDNKWKVIAGNSIKL